MKINTVCFRLLTICLGFAATAAMAITCPSAATIQDNVKFTNAIEDNGKYYVFATEPLIDQQQLYWVDLGDDISAKNASKAISKANQLISNVARLTDKPAKYIYPTDGHVYTACQYQASDGQIIIVATPDS